MDEIAWQLVTYVDATTEPVVVVTGRTGGDTAAVGVLGLVEPGPVGDGRRPWLLAAAAIALAALIGAIAVALNRSAHDVDDLDLVPAGETVVTAPSTLPELSQDDAVASSVLDAASEYFEAFAEGRAHEVMARSDPSGLSIEPEAALIGWWSEAAWPGRPHPGWPSGSCEIAERATTLHSTRVECPTAVGDPVAIELGVASLVWSIEVDEDGAISRVAEPLANGFENYSSVWSTYREYIDEFEPEGSATCDPASYQSGQISTQSGLALSRACGAVVASLADDVARWVARGHPERLELSGDALHGIWANTAGFSGLVVDFRRDGSFTIGNTGRLGEAAFTSGTYQVLDGVTIGFSVAVDAPECGGQRWTWTGSASAHGTLSVQADAPDCGAIDANWEWSRVSPASPASRELAAGDLEVEPSPLTRVDAIGLWLRVGTGDVLAIDPDGTYLSTDDGDSLGPVDVGTWTVEPDGVVTFVSNGSGRCEAGSSWTWQGATAADDLDRGSEARGRTLRAESTPLCQAIDLGDGWRLIAPERLR